MNKTSTKQVIFSTGFALFSMFFGSGNLVFPLKVGLDGTDSFFSAILGLNIGAVILPLAAMLALMTTRGSTKQFLKPLGLFPTLLITGIALSFMGPFGVVPRCITLARGATSLLFNIQQTTIFNSLFALAYCLTIFVASYKKTKIIDIIGNLLTPILILSFVVLFIAGWSSSQNLTNGSIWRTDRFIESLHTGYMTMDVLAAIFFTSFIVSHLYDKLRDRKEDVVPAFLMSAGIATFILCSVNIVLSYLANIYNDKLLNINDESLLGEIAALSLGSSAKIVMCVCVITATLTTTIILTRLFSDFLRDKILQNKITDINCLLISLAIAFPISILEFKQVNNFLGELISVMYPAILFLVINTILKWRFNIPVLRLGFWAILIIKIANYFKYTTFLNWL
jgi:branched-chain amino acid:cation transporter, LIVCS family